MPSLKSKRESMVNKKRINSVNPNDSELLLHHRLRFYFRSWSHKNSKNVSGFFLSYIIIKHVGCAFVNSLRNRVSFSSYFTVWCRKSGNFQCQKLLGDVTMKTWEIMRKGKSQSGKKKIWQVINQKRSSRSFLGILNTLCKEFRLNIFCNFLCELI